MMEFAPSTRDLNRPLLEATLKHTVDCRTVRLTKHSHVYTSGQRDETIYLIVSGQVKLLLPTPEGRECLLAIRGAGEIFGLLCLSGQPRRLETAIAMGDLVLKSIPARSFLSCLKRADLLECLVRYLAVRVAEQRELIAVLTTENSEQRLAEILLHLSRVLGKRNSHATHIEHRISHKELSEMVGTTRPRIGTFLKRFQALGLIGLTAERFLTIDDHRLREYLLTGHCPERKLRSPAGQGMRDSLPAIA
jgi:CRP/FNR family cyclic AMP-dependent transcriptional regulator